VSIRLEPIGFWSYARRDSNVFEKLGRLRKLLQDELEIQVGRDDIKIFHDVGAIDYGAEWERKLREALHDSTFFIPIVTPNYIQSEWCTRELLLFLDREKQINADYPELKGERRIFPIYFVDIQGPKPFNPDALLELRRLQWFDFTELRNKNYDSDLVRDRIATLASSMKRLLFREVEPLPSPEQRAREQAEAQAAAERAQREAQEKAVKVSTAKAEPLRFTPESEPAAPVATTEVDAPARTKADELAVRKAREEELLRKAALDLAERRAKGSGRAVPAQTVEIAPTPAAPEASPTHLGRYAVIGLLVLSLLGGMWWLTRSGAPKTQLNTAPEAQELAKLFAGTWRVASLPDTAKNCDMAIAFQQDPGDKSASMRVTMRDASFTHDVLSVFGNEIETKLASVRGSAKLTRLRGNIYSYVRAPGSDVISVTRLGAVGGTAIGSAEKLARCAD